MTWRDAFARQALIAAELGSPFMWRLLRLIARDGLPDGPVARRIAAWRGDISARGEAVALRFAGALHGLVLDGRDAGLAAVYPPNAASDDALVRAVVRAIAANEDWIMARLDLPPQTNEVARSAVLVPAARWLAARYGLPLVLSELGASAGLNLLFDRYALDVNAESFGPSDAVVTLAPDWSGPQPLATAPAVAGRAGCDLSPVDPVDDRLRLLSYIWADQSVRIARTSAALAEAARLRPSVAAADAADWLRDRLAASRPGHVHLVYHTVAWQYFPPRTGAAIEAMLAEAGASATVDARLARFGMEADDSGEPGARLWLHLWPGSVIVELGRADFHGRWVRWTAPTE